MTKYLNMSFFKSIREESRGGDGEWRCWLPGPWGSAVSSVHFIPILADTFLPLGWDFTFSISPQQTALFNMATIPEGNPPPLLYLILYPVFN
jgi:hypothetical protein